MIKSSCTRQRIRNSAKRRSSTAKSRALTTSCAFCWSFVSDWFRPFGRPQSTDDCLLGLGGARDIELRAATLELGDWQLPKAEKRFILSADISDIQPHPQSWSYFLDPILRKPLKTFASHFDMMQTKPCKENYYILLSKNLAEQ